jgi:hypothetical protein
MPMSVTRKLEANRYFSKKKPFFSFLVLFLLLFPNVGSAMQWDDVLEELKKLDLGVDGRLRWEYWSGLEAQPNSQSDYNFVSLRIRPYVKYPGEHFVFFFQFQYAGAFNLPENAVSGPGSLYFGLSKPDDAPQATDVLEFWMMGKDLLVDGLGFEVGRLGIKGGAETLYEDDKTLDWIKKVRLSERLWGTFDWTNVGRRYHAVRAFYDTEQFRVDGIASRLLAGGFDYNTAFEELDDVDLFGGVMTLKDDFLIDNTDIRIYGIYFRDDRDVAQTVTGGTLGIPAVGASWAGAYPGIGPGTLDMLVWGCYQWGDWGATDHSAYAVVAEGGYKFQDLCLQPWLRLGVALASGDDDPEEGTHKSFFGMVPTNHKWYGYMDTTALSNLINFYQQLILKPAEKVVVQMDGYLFWLHDSNDSWYAGSGATSNDVFGFVGGYNASSGTTARLTDGEGFIGGELDLTAKYEASKYVGFEATYGHFFGAAGAKAVFSENGQGDWFSIQTVVKF